MPEQQKELTHKDKFNIVFALCLFHQRCIVVICRNQWGRNALGVSCAWAFGLLFFWAAFSQDPFMYCWLVIWLLCYVKRRFEAGRIYDQVNSYYDGWPFDAVRFCGSENIAKRVIEPVLVGLLGGGLRWVYTEQGWSPAGLPNFLLLGVLTLSFVEWVKQRIHERRTQAMRDGRLEQEQLARDYRDQFGD